MEGKATVTVGYSNSTGDNWYKVWERQRLIGADITAVDGLSNEIEVHIREGNIGYCIKLNGETIAETRED